MIVNYNLNVLFQSSYVLRPTSYVPHPTSLVKLSRNDYIYPNQTLMHMKKLLLLTWVLIISLSISAYPQVKKTLHFQDPALAHSNGIISPAGCAGKLPLSPVDFPSGWQLDSTWYSSWNTTSSAWDLYERQFYTYSPNGSAMEILYLNLNEITHVWENWTRYDYVYYPSGNVLKITEQAWDVTDGIWKDINYTHFTTQGRVDTTFYKNYSRSLNLYTGGNQNIYTYNANNQYLETLSQSLDTATSSWVNWYRTQYTYINGTLVSEMLSQNWDSGLNDWMNSMKYDYTYDGSGYLISFIEYAWNAGLNSWDNFAKGAITNNAAGNPTQELDQTWDYTTTSWINSDLITYQYDSNGKETQYLYQVWDTGSSAWVNNMKETYSYYSNGIEDEDYQYAWNPNTQAYMDINYNENDTSGYTIEYYSKYIDWNSYVYTYGYKYDYTYNANHNMLESLQQLLNLNTLAWYDYSRRTDSYDANGFCTLELDQSYDTVSATWTNTFKQDHFINFTSSIREIPGMKDYCFFSNPLQAGEKIECQNLPQGTSFRISLINTVGQEIYSTSLSSGESFYVPLDIPAGMYLMQINGNSRILASGKVIILHR